VISKQKSDSGSDCEPAFTDLSQAKFAAETCKNCSLWKRATRTVFGERPVLALIMLVGEQPGDREDVRGRPFVGPAGKLLDDALHTCLLGKQIRVTGNRGQFFKSLDGLNIFVTVHPSAILRSQGKETRQAEFQQFVRDLKKVVVLLDRGASKEH
jgi:uracil-DNA glycosylase